MTKFHKVKIIKSKNFPVVLLADCLLLAAAYYLAYYLRFDGAITLHMHLGIWVTLAWILPVKMAFLFMFDLYKGMWRYTGLHDMLNILMGCVASSGAVCLVILATTRFDGFSRGVMVIDFLLTFIFLSGFRAFIRMAYPSLSVIKTLPNFGKAPNFKRLIIAGAGDAASQLLRVIKGKGLLRYDVLGLVDDNPSLRGNTLDGCRVMGNIEDLVELVHKYGVDEIIIAMPSAGPAGIRRVVEICNVAGIPCKSIPGLMELVSGRVSVSHIREVCYEDLLGRPVVHIEDQLVSRFLTGKRVMVTGGAGSIGLELCRQIAKFKPAQLIILERNESGLYDANLELLAANPGLETASILGTVQNMGRMENIFRNYRPQIVFHAAAYKHVPMMEYHPWEAVFNNILGTQTVLELCQKRHVERCVIVSTDKAVRPTNVMGASKRVVELLAQSYARLNQVRCMAVRFGNVLGSAGSVLPLFKRQIADGGPVTVTHPRVTRYFMTIPEASSLILQAGAQGNGGEIFVLKMGTPVCIGDMARDMIKLSGFIPDQDIEIRYVGLRPGEKLYEELITSGEGIQKTLHQDIMVLSPESVKPIHELKRHIHELVRLAEAEDGDGIREKLRELVPEYQLQGGGDGQAAATF